MNYLLKMIIFLKKCKHILKYLKKLNLFSVKNNLSKKIFNKNIYFSLNNS